jgi:peptidyl-prolyl cis-trans isomerase B (cyclophilin B)
MTVRVPSWLALLIVVGCACAHAQTRSEHTVQRLPGQEPPVAAASAPARPAEAPPTTAPGPTAAESRAEPLPRVALEIEGEQGHWGRIVIELERDKTPYTVRNFLRYVDEGYYDGTIFYRVAPDYLIQAGGFVRLGEPKTEGLHEPIKNEADRGLKNERGTIAMARSPQDPHTATTDFFINLVDNYKLDYPVQNPYHDKWGYCVFGRVVEGMEVVDRVAESRTRVSRVAQRAYIQNRRRDPKARPPEKYQPIDPPRITRAFRVDADGKPLTPTGAPAPTTQPDRRLPVTRPSAAPPPMPPPEDPNLPPELEDEPPEDDPNAQPQDQPDPDEEEPEDEPEPAPPPRPEPSRLRTPVAA